MARDYYEVLGVPRDAGEADIKKAYRRLAMDCHPDRNGGDPTAEERFKEATEAYEVLRDPEKRSRYDRFGIAGVRGAAAGGGFSAFDLSEALSVFMRDFGGLGGFDAIFGGGQRARRSRRRGQDLRVTLKLTLADVAHGVTHKIKVQTLDPCPACAGSGAKAGTSPQRCPTCGGAGEVRQATRSLLGQFISVAPCSACDGEGTAIGELCPECRGDGRVRASKVVDVEVPPGVADHHYITLRGKGVSGPRHGPAGDLIVEFEIEEDPRFTRRGDELIYDLPVSFSQAALGGEFTIPTPYGDETVRIPGGVQSGSVISLRGKGLPGLNDGRHGSLHVRIQVWTPPRLTPELRELFEQLAASEGEPPQGESLGQRFWNKVKETFGT